MTRRQRVFFDMDGVLAEFNEHATVEEITLPGYFGSRPPIMGAIRAMEWLVKNTKLDIYVLTSVFDDDHSRQEKLEWLRKYAPFLAEDHVLFSVYGKQTKSEAIGELLPTDMLVDDHTPNLKGNRGWHGVGVKFLNGINNRGASGGYDGYYVSVQTQPEKMAKQLAGIAMAEGGWTA